VQGYCVAPPLDQQALTAFCNRRKPKTSVA
jgi:hypothetical protein